jgi:MFS family permease
MANSRGRFGQAFSALSYGAYRQFAISLLLTSLGAQLLQTAIFWQVYELTGDELLLGLTGLARAAPHMLLSLVGGVIADRVNRVRLIQAGQVVNAVLIAALAGLTLAGTAEVWHLYAITVLNSAFTAVTQPGRTAVIPSLIPQEKLVNAIALNATITQTSQIVGPAFAGLAIGALSLGAVYVANGVFYFLAMLALVVVRVPPPAHAATETPWRSFLDGLTFVRRTPVIISLMAMDMAATVLGSYRALLPVFADNLGVGAGGYGVLSAAPGVGSLIGSAFILSLGDMRYRGLYCIFAIFGYCAALVLLALSPWFVLALVACAFLGTTDAIQMVSRNSTIIAISPDAMRGRVEAFRTMLAGGGPPLGFMLSGGLAAVIGASAAVSFGAVACAALVAGIGSWRKELRDPNLGSIPTPEPSDEVAIEQPARQGVG